MSFGSRPKKRRRPHLEVDLEKQHGHVVGPHFPRGEVVGSTGERNGLSNRWREKRDR